MFENIVPDTYTNYDVPTTEDVDAFRRTFDDPSTDSPDTVIIGVGIWFDRVVVQHIYRHSRTTSYCGRLVAIDLIMFLVTSGYALEHCSVTLYASQFPTSSALSMADLQTQADNYGSTLQKMEVKYAKLTKDATTSILVSSLQRSSVLVEKMTDEDWNFVWDLERKWTKF